MERSAINLGRESLAGASGVKAAEILHWDIRSLPMRDVCVDAIVTDLPFGKRVGSRAENQTLYPALLKEVCVPGLALCRACFLVIVGRAVRTSGRVDNFSSAQEWFAPHGSKSHAVYQLG